MASPSKPSDDEALLARLNALRPTSVTVSQPKAPLPIAKAIETPESGLTSRLSALRAASASSSASLPRPSSPPPTPARISLKGEASSLGMSSPHHDHDLIARPTPSAVASIDVDGKRQDDTSANEGPISDAEHSARRLRDDTAAVLANAKRALARDEDSDNELSNSSTAAGSDPEDSKDEVENDDAESQAILLSLMDEVDLENEKAHREASQNPEPPLQSPSHHPSPPTPHAEDPKIAQLHALHPPPSLPSAPTTPPINSLGLPSAPTTAPGPTPPKYADFPRRDKICKICYAPAKLYCEGCVWGFEEWNCEEDAMFCGRCWGEWHEGMMGHKAVGVDVQRKDGDGKGK